MLNIYSLNNARDKKQLNRMQIYKRVLKKCHHKIKLVASKGISFCFYIVPEYLYGIPRYNTLNCATFIVNKLRENGFKVTYTYPNLVYISWEHIPSEIKNSNNEIIKTVIEDKKPIESTKLITYPEYRYIEDYKPSKRFLRRIKPN